MRNIVLAGFMGTGKTCVGKKLAGRLGIEFVDLDDVIEAREGRLITQIFAEKGEAYFRGVEKALVREFSEKTPFVIATGGGAVVDQENLRLLKKSGVVILLEADIETILERTHGQTHRPLLMVADPKGRIKELLEARAPFYKKADYAIDTTSLNVDEVVERILSLVS
ncbi:MAG: shikimate kinase [Candidatus Omnitrophica bacterium]|nr:shikimate kinase [Candidatus Omnitrophota bacterium]